jgi:DNA-binding CsgD family transcriptional regulator
MVTEDYDPDLPARYFPIVRPLEERLLQTERTGRLDVFDRRTLWGESYDDYLRSAYYNDFIPTPQEARVAVLLAARKTNAEIGAALGISPHTARTHAGHMLQKTGAASRYDVPDTVRPVLSSLSGNG